MYSINQEMILINKIRSINKAIKVADKEFKNYLFNYIKKEYRKNKKWGMLTYLEFEEEEIIETDDYYEIEFTKGIISWQEFTKRYKETEIYYDIYLEDYKQPIAKCLIDKKNGKFTYIGEIIEFV